MRPHRPTVHRIALPVVLGLLASLLASLLAATAPVTPSAQAAAATAAAPKVPAGRYAGTLLDVDDGTPSTQEYVKFKVSAKQRVTKLRTRAWLACYQYPNTYYQLPFVVEMPTARIRRRALDHAWTQQVVLEDRVETLSGQVQLRFRKNGRVSGRISVDVANCATRLGDPPYWVELAARRR